VRFATAEVEVVVRVTDNPTSRDFVSKLPLTLTFEDFAGKEKLSHLSERLNTEGSSGSAPSQGDFIYYKPWGNVAFFYNAGGGHDDNVIPIGTVESGTEYLTQFDQSRVAVAVIE
jgi:hypothetical protein